jgi:hypothetical protein
MVLSGVEYPAALAAVWVVSFTCGFVPHSLKTILSEFRTLYSERKSLNINLIEYSCLY